MMASYLFVFSIGPVQGFIASARRTRDLWMGSHLLSEISKAAAKKISDKDGQLIFPSLSNDKLDPSESPDAPNVANIILAEIELPNDEDPLELNQRVRAAAQDEWMQYAKGAKYLADRYSGEFIRKNIWENQVQDVLEFYSAWIQVPKDKYDYPVTRKTLMRLLDGRKSIRDFIQEKKLDLKLPKSSLDGARDTVLSKKINDIPEGLAFKMRPKAGEQLCAVALTKRLGGKRFDNVRDIKDPRLESFPSVVRVALDPWIRGIVKAGGEAKRTLDEIKKICEDNERIAQGSGKWRNGEHRYPDFPYDGHVLYLSRIISMINAIKMSNDPKKRTRGRLEGWEARLNNDDMKALLKIEGLVERLQKSGKTKSGEKGLGFGKPMRYYTVLVADGDRMGKVISGRKKEDHIKISHSLSKFALEAREIVRKHHGCMVYSGGDDVLAFLPLDCCLQAARSLHERFGDLLKEYEILDSEDNDAKPKFPTLSVGIAIGHSMEPLEDMLSFGREAENAAKKGTTNDDERNGIAVHVYPRSGVPIKVREQWKAKGENGLDERLLKWARMHCNDELSDRSAYDMHELAEDYHNWSASTEEEKKNLNSIISGDVLRLLKRKRAGYGDDAIKNEILNDFRDMLNGIDSYEKIYRLANELIIARRLASALKQANPEPKNKENVTEGTY